MDTAVVGHLGVVSLSGLGIAAALFSLLLVVGDFVEYGTTGRSARWFGAGQTDRAVDEGVQARWLAVGIGTVLVAVGEVFAEPATRLLAGGAGATADAATSWLRIGLVGLPGVLLMMAGNGWTRGVQQTRTPVAIVLGTNAVSAALCPVFVYGAGLGLRGSAVANLVAQVIGATLFLAALHRRALHRRAGFWRAGFWRAGFWRPRPAVLRAQLVVGRELVVRSVAFQVAFLTAAGGAARFGPDQVAAHQVGLQLWTFLALVLDAFAVAAQSLVGAALGTGDVPAARGIGWRVAAYGTGGGVVLAVGLAVFNADAGVRHQIGVVWPWLAVMMPAGGLVFALDGVLIGAGDVRFLRTVTLLGAVAVFAPLNLAAVRFDWGLGGVWAGLTSFIVVRLVGGVLRVRGTAWTRHPTPDTRLSPVRPDRAVGLSIPPRPPRSCPFGQSRVAVFRSSRRCS